MKTKTASVRLSKEMFEEIDNVCNDVGCTRNDWIKDTLKNKLRTQLEEIKSTTDTPRPEYRTKPRVRIDGIPIGEAIPQISYDNGKTWIDEPKIRIRIHD